jgi:retron-type reverse transcriptase
MSLPERDPKRERELAMQRERQAAHAECLTRHVRVAHVEYRRARDRPAGRRRPSSRIAQTTVKMWLEPRLDPVFRDDSYGYRPEKSALEAIAVTRRRCWDYDWVVEFESYA